MPHQGTSCTNTVRIVLIFDNYVHFAEIVSNQTYGVQTGFDMLLWHRYYSPRSHDSSVVQSVERRTVNPYVTGSSPVRGAIFKKPA